jgi:hypothetical protein
MKLVYSLLISGAVFFVISGLIFAYSRKKTLTIFDDPKRVKKFLTGFFISLIVLLGCDFFIHKHDHISLGNAPEFYAVYGFVSCVMLIFIAKILRLFIKRDETYYY